MELCYLQTSFVDASCYEQRNVHYLHCVPGILNYSSCQSFVCFSGYVGVSKQWCRRVLLFGSYYHVIAVKFSNYLTSPNADNQPLSCFDIRLPRTYATKREIMQRLPKCRSEGCKHAHTDIQSTREMYSELRFIQRLTKIYPDRLPILSLILSLTRKLGRRATRY